jgi:integrase/recombinase XerD
MIEDMTVRKFTLKTQSDYIRVIKNFTIFLGRSPDTASNEDLRNKTVAPIASSGAG